MSEYLYQAFFYRYLAQAKLTVSLLKSFKYVVTKGEDFNYLIFSGKWSGRQNTMIYDLMIVGLLQHLVLWSAFCKPWITEIYIVKFREGLMYVEGPIF